MGFFSKLVGVAAPIVGGIFGGPAGAAIGSALGGAVAGKSSSGGGAQTATQTTQQQMDPRNAAILYGNGTPGNQGLLSQYQGYLNAPQSAGTAAFGNAATGFLGGQGSTIMNQLQAGATGMLNSNTAAPQSTAANAGAANTYNSQNAMAAQFNGPRQGNMDLSGAYDKVINGDAAANPYLTGALQSAVDQTNTSYDRNQTNLTNNLQRNVLPGIRSNSVLAGQYGGTRQGIAEGNAISDYTNQLSSANLALGQANSANTIGAQAQSYNQGQDRSLAALQGLSGQQFGAASQTSAQQQQTNLANANAQNAAAANNANAYNNQNQFNAGLQQQSGLANQSAQLQTNALNSNNQQAGMAGLSGLLSNAYGYAQNQNNYDINRAGQVNGLLAPYLGMGGSTVSNSSQQMPSNTGANILGGATAGLGLFNGIKNSGLLGDWGSSGASNIQPNTWMPSAQNITPYR